eukprot:CAMPEP_0171325598 /NCGR_PEP_ID=MMETSP0816-20121228/116907_1 /TAXON_ID=420281 /ORGANISM="Proboscia inermis, Strain CCAP1064/1" /LENGTH=218 /DNA_ID=CAMNT_0011824809 /DNA_START=496 /DNA_END=1152 /DNA_ORIENTATION=+
MIKQLLFTGVIIASRNLCNLSCDGFVVISRNSLKNRYIPSKATSTNLKAVQASGLWNAGNKFGKGPFRYYDGFDKWMEPFPQTDRDAMPEYFQIPEGAYEIIMNKPCGIVFEEMEIGRGVKVTELVEGGNAAKLGDAIQPGDVLIGVTAVKNVGAKWERRLIPAINLSFDTVVAAIGSNEPRWGCSNVILMFARNEYSDEIKTFMDFFEPPRDNPWKL